MKKLKLFSLIATSSSLVMLAAGCQGKDKQKDDANKPVTPGTDSNNNTPKPVPKPVEVNYNYDVSNLPEYLQKNVANYIEEESKFYPQLYEKIGQVDEEIINKMNQLPKSVVEKFNNQADKTLQQYYNDAYLKNYSLPNEKGELVLNPIEIYLRKAYSKAAAGDRGKARFLKNDLYKKMALQSYSIVFSNKNEIIEKNSLLKNQEYWLSPDKPISPSVLEYGTAWILDYEPTNDGSYPTKWYIATNLHVAMALKKHFDKSSKYIFSNEPELQKENDDIQAAAEKVKRLKDTLNPNEPSVEYTNAVKEYEKALENMQGQTQWIELNHFNENTPINKALEITSKSPYVDRVKLTPSQVNIIYAGTNFLKQNPSEYLAADSKFKDLQEMADFAVLEVDFSKQAKTSDNFYEYSTVNGPQKIDTIQNLAKKFTASYAELNESEKPKLANFDLIQNYDALNTEKVTVGSTKITKINVDLLALGFPRAKYDYGSKPSFGVTNPAEEYEKDFTTSLWTNKSNDDTRGVAQYGNSLSKSVAMRNFIAMPGITDIMITNTIINNKTGFNVRNLKNIKDTTYSGYEYINYGLGYNLTSWEPLQGASGSLIKDIDNNILAINFAAGDAIGNSLVSLTQALRSNGYDYKGQYGKYNLEQYDLVYGGGKNQYTSYRWALQQIYGDAYKTRLFENGVNVIPNNYQFK